MGTKEEYEEGYARGRREANKIPSVLDILSGALIPGTLPSEKGTAHYEGYKQGLKDEQEKKK